MCCGLVFFSGVLKHLFSWVLKHVFSGILKLVFSGVLKHVFSGILKHVFSGVLKHVFSVVRSGSRGGCSEILERKFYHTFSAASFFQAETNIFGLNIFR